MLNILAITRRELNGYFTTPVAYVMMCGLTFLGSYFFVNFVQQFIQASLLAQQMPQYLDPGKLNLTDAVMAPLLFNLAVILVFVMPFVSMRLLAEERRQGTLELLMTAPINSTELVLGKYLGGLVLVTLTLALTLLYPAVLTYFGGSTGGSPLEWSTVACGYLGLFCWAAASLAIGLFVSALTDSQVVSAIITFALLLLTWIISWVADRAEAGVLKDVLANLSSSQHLIAFVKGELALKDLVYFGSLMVLGLFLTQRAVESHRWS